MKYNFDQMPDRHKTNSLKWDVKENELPMWVADMDFDSAPAIKEALMKRVNQGAFGYTMTPDGWYDAYISWWQRRYDFTISRDWLIFTTGVVPAISSLVRKLTTPAEKVVVQTPVYDIFFNSIINNGRIPLESPLKLVNNEYEMDFARLEKDLSDAQTTLMILCNPQNPGGKIWTKEDLEKVAKLCERYGVKVISDEIHCDLTAPGKSYVPFASVSETARKISVTCISPSKAFNVAGIHSAAVVVPDENLRHRVWRSLNTDEVAEGNVFAFIVPMAAYNDSEDWFDELRDYLSENRKFAEDYIAKEIPELRVIHSDATYLLWIDISELTWDDQAFACFLREKTGLYISDGSQYGQAGTHFIRMNLAAPRSIVDEGLKRLKRGISLFSL